MDTTCISPLPLFAIRHSPKGMAAGKCPQMAFLDLASLSGSIWRYYFLPRHFEPIFVDSQALDFRIERPRWQA
jgi:hypothetical protein